MADAAFIKRKIAELRKTLAIKEHELEQSKLVMQEKYGTIDVGMLLQKAESADGKLKENEVQMEDLIQKAERIIEEIQQVG